MEGKTVVLSVFIMSLVLAQVLVDAKSCCPNTTARNIYNACRLAGGSQSVCATASGCIHQTSSICRPPFPSETLEFSEESPREVSLVSEKVAKSLGGFIPYPECIEKCDVCEICTLPYPIELALCYCGKKTETEGKAIFI